MIEELKKEAMDQLLHLWDWHRRIATEDYSYGYCDAIGQCVLDLGKIFGEGNQKPYIYEAYKRVMEDTTMEEYWRKYPTPLASYFPAETIRQNGGKL